MTVETLMRLEAISDPATDLEWRTKSYDEGHPLCICSACGERILDSDTFDADSDEADDNVAIRLWRGGDKATEEATLHSNCFTLLHNKGVFVPKNDDINYDEQL